MSGSQPPSQRDYHLLELEIARNQSHPARLLPRLPASTGRLLDIGCGAGQTVMAMKLDGWTAVGIDIDLEALSLGAELSGENSGLSLLSAGAENLPFRSNSFDFVISRVALPYTNIPAVIAEVSRVLRPSGSFWFTLHSPSMFRASNIRSVRSAIYAGYVAVNSLLFRYFGWQFRYPLNRSRIESYQTEEGMRRCLAAHSLKVSQVVIDGQNHFLIEGGAMTGKAP